MATMSATSARGSGMTKEEKFVITASSTGTIFEWYDFYLYAVLAPFFAALFFPPGNDTAALLSAFATYAAGFLVRPFGALLFGRIGDLVGRKYTFLVTIIVMGAATFAVGLLPTFASIGWLAPILLVSLRLAQGLALGGEYGGAATYVAEHARPGERGFATSWIQTTATLGLLMALIVIGLCRTQMDAKTFSEWGWRLPFLVSVFLLGFSVWIRLKLNETPIFQKMKEEGKGSKAPLTESFFHYPNNKYVLLALLGATAGQGVVWYTGQFYALFFLVITLKLDYLNAYYLIAAFADPRHAVLHFLRMAVRQDRPPEDHPGGLPDRSDHLLPAVRRVDESGQSGPCGIPGEAGDLRHCRSCELQLPHLRRPVVEVHRLRPRQGLRDQARRLVQDREWRGWFGAGAQDRQRHRVGLEHAELAGGVQQGRLSGQG